MRTTSEQFLMFSVDELILAKTVAIGIRRGKRRQHAAGALILTPPAL